MDFEVEANVEGWLPIGLEEAGGRLTYTNTTCPKDCTCDEQTGVIGCRGQELSETGIAITTQGAINIVTERNIIEDVDKIELKQTEEKILYEINGFKNAKLLFFIPIQMDVKTSVNAKTGDIEKTQKPWWSFLVW